MAFIRKDTKVKNMLKNMTPYEVIEYIQNKEGNDIIVTSSLDELDDSVIDFLLKYNYVSLVPIINKLSFENVKKVVKCNGNIIANIHFDYDRFSDEEKSEIDDVAVKTSPESIQYVWNQTKELVLYALRENGSLIKHIREHRSIYDITAVKQNPDNIWIIDEKYRTTKLFEIVAKSDRPELIYKFIPNRNITKTVKKLAQRQIKKIYNTL